MIKKLDLNDGRFVSIMEKINELVDVVNELDKRAATAALDFENHTHSVIGINTGQESTTGPLVTMVNDSDDDAPIRD